MKPKKLKKIKIRERKLGRHQAHGMVHDYDKANPLIEIDPKIGMGFDRLVIVVHESLHCAFPTMDEQKIIYTSKLIASVIWADKFRHVDSL